MAVDEQSLEDGAWSDRCLQRMIELDPQLDPELARPIADDMCSRARWRAMAPEDAAQFMFDVGTKRGTPPLL